MTSMHLSSLLSPRQKLPLFKRPLAYAATLARAVVHRLENPRRFEALQAATLNQLQRNTTLNRAKLTLLGTNIALGGLATWQHFRNQEQSRQVGTLLERLNAQSPTSSSQS